ncbi:MAG: hypothetical protein Q9217_006953, partial [Psora testacea]
SLFITVIGTSHPIDRCFNSMPHQPARPNDGARPKAVALASTPQRQSLLALPLELREEIYAHFVYETASTTLRNLLLVNRRLAREVKPFLYKRPLFFDGQCDLFHWLNVVDHDYLRHVTDVKLKLLDINAETIVGALGKRLREANLLTGGRRRPEIKDNPYYQACSFELRRLQKALTLLSGVRSFTIVACTPSDSSPPPQMVQSFSNLLGHCFPDLQSLISEEQLFPIDFIRNKPRLDRLRFPANSESSEDEIASVFGRLSSDLQLEVCRLSPPRGVTYEWGCLADILPHVPPLRRLVLFERLESHQSCLSEEVFVDAIEAMKRHLSSLRQLTLIAVPPAGPREAGIMRRNLLRFVEASSLRHVEVLGVYASVYRHLPTTTETFVLRLDQRSTLPSTSFTKAVTEIMSHVKFRAITAAKDLHIPKLSRLRDIQIWVAEHPVNSHTGKGDDTEEMLDRVTLRLQKLGIKFILTVNAELDHKMTGSEEHL